MKAKLLEWREIAPEVRHFVFEVSGVDEMQFTPGQFLFLKAELAGNAVSRAYSIASQPDGNRFELCLNRVQEGVFSPHLFDLEPGDTVEMRGPYGVFVLRKPVSDSLLIATGTGIAPFRGMLQASLPRQTGRQFTLLFGVRHEHSIFYRCEFEEMQRRYSRFRFWPTLSRPEANWTGRRGRVQEHIAEAVGERRDIDVYVCGLKEMVNDVRGLLKDMGFDRHRIIFERYD